MKSVLISIQPKWCELIANGKKTIEVRKTKPKLKTPFKCYIYCTKSTQSDRLWVLCKNERKENFGLSAICANLNATSGICLGDGKVIGEFVCDKIEYFNSVASEFAYSVAPPDIHCTLPMSEKEAFETCYEQGCLSTNDVISYFGVEDWKAYFWYISNLKIYDKPQELSEFGGLRKTKFGYEPIEIKKPPQSWCYVEESE